MNTPGIVVAPICRACDEQRPYQCYVSFHNLLHAADNIGQNHVTLDLKLAIGYCIRISMSPDPSQGTGLLSIDAYLLPCQNGVIRSYDLTLARDPQTSTTHTIASFAQAFATRALQNYRFTYVRGGWRGSYYWMSTFIQALYEDRILVRSAEHDQMLYSMFRYQYNEAIEVKRLIWFSPGIFRPSHSFRPRETNRSLFRYDNMCSWLLNASHTTLTLLVAAMFTRHLDVLHLTFDILSAREEGTPQSANGSARLLATEVLRSRRDSLVATDLVNASWDKQHLVYESLQDRYGRVRWIFRRLLQGEVSASDRHLLTLIAVMDMAGAEDPSEVSL